MILCFFSQFKLPKSYFTFPLSFFFFSKKRSKQDAHILYLLIRQPTCTSTHTSHYFSDVRGELTVSWSQVSASICALNLRSSCLLRRIASTTASLPSLRWSFSHLLAHSLQHMRTPYLQSYENLHEPCRLLSYCPVSLQTPITKLLWESFV